HDALPIYGLRRDLGTWGWRCHPEGLAVRGRRGAVVDLLRQQSGRFRYGDHGLRLFDWPANENRHFHQQRLQRGYPMQRVLPLLFMLLFAFPAFGQQLSGGGGGGGGSGGATSANQTNASQKTQIVDGSGNVIAATSNNLNVQCANCSGSGASAADGASFTAGMSVFAPSGCFYQTTATSNALTTGLQGFAQCTAQRAWFTNLRNASGVEVGTASTPLQVSIANTGANSTAVLVNQPTAANLNVTAVGTGTFSTQSASTASSGSIASGAVASGAYASGSISDGAGVTLGAMADARSTA